MADVNITVDGKKLTVPAGTLLIEACKRHGIEIPAFCYYPGLSLQGACRMCLVRIEKVPKLQTACTTVVQEGMIVTSESEEVRQARQAMLEFVLQNHPLDCPVCDAGGQCELQDMTLRYGAPESKLIDKKNHKDEEQWSPVVFFDRPRCIMCYRCVRVCGEGMDVWTLGIQNRNSSQVIAPNMDGYLECEECGMCIDICPVGALTSGTYRYKTRPWEMKHVGTTCMYCADGCKTTLGVRRSPTGMEIVRGDNRDKSGINGDFLCIKGRYAFDAVEPQNRITEPLVRRNAKLVPASWDEALTLVAKKFKEAGNAVGVVGGTHITNEEAYLLQKFARVVLGTNNIDHHRTADFPAFSKALSGYKDATATMRDVFTAPAVLLIGNDPTNQHPLLAWQIRTNVRLRRARLYAINAAPNKLQRQAQAFMPVPSGTYSKVAAFLAGDDRALDALLAPGSGEPKPLILPPGLPMPSLPQPTRTAWIELREKLKSEQNLIIVFGAELRGADIENLRKFGEAVPGAKFICLGDYANSRGAADMGLYPHLLPGYIPVDSGQRFVGEWLAKAPAQPGLALPDMMKAAQTGTIKALYIVGSNPASRFATDPFTFHKAFTVVQDLFLTDTAIAADVVLPAASPYEKTGTYTNTCGDIQMNKKAADVNGTKTDFEIIVRIAEKMGIDLHELVPFGRAMRADMGQSRGAQSGEADRHSVWLVEHGLESKMSPFDAMALLDEIQRLVPGYQISRRNLLAGSEEHTNAIESGIGVIEDRPELIVPSNDTLFTAGTLGRYSNTLNSVIENNRAVPVDDVLAD